MNGEKKSSFSRDVALVTIARVFTRAATFLTGVAVARLIGPEGRGLVASLAVPANLAVTFGEMGIRQATAFQIGRGIQTVRGLLPTLLTMALMSSAVAIAASFLYYRLLHIAREDLALQVIAVLIIPTSMLTNYASGVFLGRQKIAAFRQVSWGPALLNLGMVVALGWYAGFKIHGVMIATALASAAGCAYALYLLSREAPLSLGFNPKVASSLSAMGMRYAIALFILTLNYKLSIMLLQRFGTLTDVGLYAQGAAIAELIWEIPTAINALVFSRSANSKSDRDFSQKVMTLARLSFLVALAAGLGIAAIAPIAFPLIYGPGFADSANVFTVLIPGVVAFTAFKILNMDLAGKGKPWVSLIVIVPTALLNGVLSWLLIGRYGAVGGAISTSISYVLATIAFVALYSRTMKVDFLDIVTFRKSDFIELAKRLPFKRSARM